jgi:hypothetical protein
MARCRELLSSTLASMQVSTVACTAPYVLVKQVHLSLLKPVRHCSLKGQMIQLNQARVFSSGRLPSLSISQLNVGQLSMTRRSAHQAGVGSTSKAAAANAVVARRAAGSSGTVLLYGL